MPPAPSNRPDPDENPVPSVTPVRDRGDACPGALRLHTADDGALARVRVPAGVLSAAQAYALADAAERLGDGALDITSRGNVQLRGLEPGCGGELARLLDAAGLLPAPRHERVRNVVASPLSGLDGRGHLDVQPLVRDLDALLCASARAPELSGRFLFALDDGRGDMAEFAADVMLLAEPGGAAVRVTVGGAAVRVRAEDGPRAMLLAANAFLDAAAASGTRAWRVRELPAAHAVSAADLRARVAAAGLAAVATASPPCPDRAPGRESRPLVGAGHGAVYVAAPLGRLRAAQWRLVAGVAERYGTGELRVTPWRGVVVPGAGPERLGALEAAGLVTDPASPWLGVGACTGRPGCAKSLADVRADATDLLPAGAGGLPVHWSGCERRCGHPRGARVDVVATGDAHYQVSTPGAPPRTVPLTELAGALAAARTTTPTKTPTK
ncbi:precorrin-3B synthase [Streptomyces sp. NPDC048389]|uniref:precorrin-3B synthase n=1 Tax=Streptomyces sp. NPDC048389 TaxID=3154622 RepID=UPI003453CAB3